MCVSYFGWVELTEGRDGEAAAKDGIDAARDKRGKWFLRRIAGIHIFQSALDYRLAPSPCGDQTAVPCFPIGADAEVTRTHVDELTNGLQEVALSHGSWHPLLLHSSGLELTEEIRVETISRKAGSAKCPRWQGFLVKAFLQQPQFFVCWPIDKFRKVCEGTSYNLGLILDSLHDAFGEVEFMLNIPSTTRLADAVSMFFTSASFSVWSGRIRGFVSLPEINSAAVSVVGIPEANQRSQIS